MTTDPTSPIKQASITDHWASKALKLHPGEIVEVRGENEILSTLDERGTLERLPFLPQMRSYCGNRFRVMRRADKIIAEGFGMRRMRNAVILEGATCDGNAQGGCNKTCLILWKEAWLKRVERDRKGNQYGTGVSRSSASQSRRVGSNMFLCQSKSLMEATSPLPRWDLRRYLWDFTSGAYTPSEWLRTMLISASLRVRILVGQSRRNKLEGGLKRTPATSLALQPDDVVRVRSKEEITQTLDHLGRNRGLEFTPEMEKYCGKTFRVLKRLERMITDQGIMRQIANTVLLEGATCDGKAHGGCPRNCHCLWREIWLERA